jgi:mRNA interferase MazF
LGGPAKEDAVVVPFPFADLTRAKRRPALVLAALQGGDLILCQITSRHVRDPHAVLLAESDVEGGSLRRPSNARPNRLFTADRSIVLYRIGRLAQQTITDVIDKAVEILGS